MSKIAGKIRSLREDFESQVTRSVEQLATADEKGQRAAHKQVEMRARRHLKLFNAIVLNMPECLEWDVQKRTQVSKEERHALRHTFRQSLRQRTLEQSASDVNDMAAYIDMDLTIEQIQAIARKRRYPAGLDLSSEHYHALSNGGDNSPNNIGIVPEYFNFFRNKWERMQTDLNPDTGEILTFIPRKINGKIPRVPVLPNGFRDRDRAFTTLKTRVEELFGTKIDITTISDHETHEAENPHRSNIRKSRAKRQKSPKHFHLRRRPR